MTRAVFAILAALVVVCAFLPPAQAQQQRPRNPFGGDPLTVSADVLEAVRLLSVNPNAAITLLHQLNTRFPGRDDILSRLGYAMQVVDQPDSAVYYYRAALSANPLNLEAGKALGSIYFSRGNEQEAMQVFDRMIEAHNHNVSAYRIVAGALRDLGRVDEAIIMLERGRERSKKSQSLTFELASLYKQIGDPRRALDEYLGYAAAEPKSYRLVRERMLEVLRDAGREQASLATHLTTRADRGGAESFAAIDVLAAWYLERGLLENALEMALRADARKASDGATLLSLAEDVVARAESRPRGERARYLDLGVRAGEAYVSGHSKSPGMDRATYLLARLYTEYGSGASPAVPVTERAAYLERAIARYDELARTYSGSEFAERAYLERGDVLLRKLKRVNPALESYKAGAVNARRLHATYASRIASVYIGAGRDAEANQYLKALARSDDPSVAEAAQYWTGVRLMANKDYGTARDTLSALAEASPSSAFTNDAIATAWMIEEALTSGSESLDDFVTAMKADMVGDTTAMVFSLRTIVDRSAADAIRPRAVHRLGLVVFDQGNFEVAIGLLRRFLTDYPEHEQCPVVLRDVGRVYETGLGRYDQALHEYEQVLLSYPEYTMLDDVRRDVERVRDLLQGGTYAP